MSAHDQPRHVCPYCLKWFGTREGVTAHQKAVRHRAQDRYEGADLERAMRRYDHDRRAQLKQENRTMEDSETITVRLAGEELAQLTMKADSSGRTLADELARVVGIGLMFDGNARLAGNLATAGDCGSAG